MPIDALTPGSALLVVKRGPNAGSRFLLDRDVTTAGRHPDSDIFLDDVTVSRRHVEFRRESDGFAVHDVGSLNGTYVNRERIDSALLSGGRGADRQVPVGVPDRRRGAERGSRDARTRRPMAGRETRGKG